MGEPERIHSQRTHPQHYFQQQNIPKIIPRATYMTIDDIKAVNDAYIVNEKRKAVIARTNKKADSYCCVCKQRNHSTTGHK
ncbi:MAG TPA: hypothetical protein DD649_19620 [Providencia sp.]|uniref:hypothetical protein n=1 Tax=Providencia sp. TaxID=589 RepID=UPI000E82F4AD|nr:hypothetical protein [Providencia sp.]HBO25072.1 hypothetical protein [Providencia sp.]